MKQLALGQAFCRPGANSPRRAFRRRWLMRVGVYQGGRYHGEFLHISASQIPPATCNGAREMLEVARYRRVEVDWYARTH
jgi:hypothetical protein